MHEFPDWTNFSTHGISPFGILWIKIYVPDFIVVIVLAYLLGIMIVSSFKNKMVQMRSILKKHKVILHDI